MSGQAMTSEEALAAIREAQMHMQGKFNSPGAREITHGRLDALRAHVESQAARIAELEAGIGRLADEIEANVADEVSEADIAYNHAMRSCAMYVRSLLRITHEEGL